MVSDTICAFPEDVQGDPTESDSKALPSLLVIVTAGMPVTWDQIQPIYLWFRLLTEVWGMHAVSWK